MKIHIGHIGVLLAMVFMFSCSSVKVYTEKSEVKEDKVYRTFAVINQYQGKDAWNSPVLDQNLIHGLTEGMKERGFEEDNQNPDLVLRYNTLLSEREKEVSRHQYPMWGYGWRMYNPWMYRMPYAYWPSPTELEKYNLGEVVIDFIDPNLDQVILRISAVGEVNNPKQKNKNIEVSVNKILSEFSKRIVSGSEAS